ncbi:hypothetical protein DERP_002282, partial [Dermatophagoides pteronyssinus]
IAAVSSSLLDLLPKCIILCGARPKRIIECPAYAALLSSPIDRLVNTTLLPVNLDLKIDVIRCLDHLPSQIGSPAIVDRC